MRCLSDALRWARSTIRRTDSEGPHQGRARRILPCAPSREATACHTGVPGSEAEAEVPAGM